MKFLIHVLKLNGVVTKVLSVTERTFGIQTHVVAVDFNEGRPVYEKIKKELEDKEIGILG